MSDREHITRRYFCREEAEAIEALPEGARARAFFCCWTRKEAYMKAVGTGFGVALDSFRVTVEPDEPARLIHIGGRPEAAENWTMYDLPLGPGCAAALALEDRGRTVEVLRLEAEELWTC